MLLPDSVLILGEGKGRLNVLNERRPMSAVRFEGVFPILVTPFDEEGEVDLASFDRTVRFMVDIGVDGVTVLGVLGESNRMVDAEREQLIRMAVDAADGRIPVVAGDQSQRDGSDPDAEPDGGVPGRGRGDGDATTRTRAERGAYFRVFPAGRRGDFDSCCGPGPSGVDTGADVCAADAPAD